MKNNFIYLLSEDGYRDSINLHNFADTYEKAIELVKIEFRRYISERVVTDISIEKDTENYTLLSISYYNDDEYEQYTRTAEYTLYKVYNFRYGYMNIK